MYSVMLAGKVGSPHHAPGSGAGETEAEYPAAGETEAEYPAEDIEVVPCQPDEPAGK